MIVPVGRVLRRLSSKTKRVGAERNVRRKEERDTFWRQRSSAPESGLFFYDF